MKEAGHGSLHAGVPSRTRARVRGEEDPLARGNSGLGALDEVARDGDELGANILAQKRRVPVGRDVRRDDEDHGQESRGDGAGHRAAADDGEPPRLERRVARRAHEVVDVVADLRPRGVRRRRSGPAAPGRPPRPARPRTMQYTQNVIRNAAGTARGGASQATCESVEVVRVLASPATERGRRPQPYASKISPNGRRSFRFPAPAATHGLL